VDWKGKEYWIVIGLLLMTGVYVNILRYSRVTPDKAANLKGIPLAVGQWEGEEFYLDERTNEILKADQTIFRRYRSPDGGVVELFIAYFGSQKYGAQIHSPKHCLPGGGWKILRRERHKFQFQRSKETFVLPVNKMLISDGKNTDLMFYWFITRRGIITNEFMLKLDLALNSLMRRPTDAAFIRIMIPFDKGGQRQALEIGQRFIDDILDNLKYNLPF